MATPKSKTSKARSAQRRSHDALSVMPCTVCKTCGEKKTPASRMPGVRCEIIYAKDKKQNRARIIYCAFLLFLILPCQQKRKS